MKVGIFNQEKVLVGAFYAIVQLHRLIVYNSTAKARWLPLVPRCPLHKDEET